MFGEITPRKFYEGQWYLPKELNNFVDDKVENEQFEVVLLHRPQDQYLERYTVKYTLKEFYKWFTNNLILKD